MTGRTVRAHLIVTTLAATIPLAAFGAVFPPDDAAERAALAASLRSQIDAGEVEEIEFEGRRLAALGGILVRVDQRQEAALGDARWTGGTVFYQFDPEVSNENKGKWRDIANEWNFAVGIDRIEFLEGTGDGNYVYVRTSPKTSELLGPGPAN